MSLKQEEKFHGVTILRLLEEISLKFPEARFALGHCKSRSSYVIKGRLLKEKRHMLVRSTQVAVEFSAGLFVKTSMKRVSPWAYTFQKEHQDEILELKKECGEVFVVFVNGDDGIAGITFDQLKQILDYNHEQQEWVRISRKLRETYRISGNDGKLDKPLPKNSFPKIVSEYFERLIKDADGR
jgi:hypothetical protein